MTCKNAWIIHAGAIGDFVLTLSVTQALRRVGHGPIRVLGRALYREIVDASAGIDAIECIDGPPWHRLFGDEPEEAIAALTTFGAPGTVIDMLGISEPAADGLRAVGVGHLVQLDPRPDPDSIVHITKQWEARIQAQGVDLTLDAPVLRDATRQSSNPSAVLHVGSGGRHKCWPIDRWISLANRLKDDGTQMTFPLGPAELESQIVAEQRPQLDRLGDILATPPISQLKSLIAGARVYVGNDSGITHLAAAMGTPSVAIFAATDPRIWRPLGSRVAVVGDLGSWPSVDDVAAAVSTAGQTHDRV